MYDASKEFGQQEAFAEVIDKHPQFKDDELREFKKRGKVVAINNVSNKLKV
jgi:hypothetical protein